VVYDQRVEIAGVGQRPPHYLRIGHARVAIGEGPAPAALSRPISVISAPAMPFVSAAIGWMLTIAVSRARRRMKSTVAELSMTGLVSGWQMMVVMPPAAAALAGGGKRLTMAGAGFADKARMSISPGATILPRN